MSANEWGKSGWHFIHAVAMGFPENPTEEQVKAYRDFFESLQATLPCPFCAINFQKKIQDHPPVLTNTKDLFNWTVDIHNMVNKDLGKKQLTHQEALQEFIKNSTQTPSTKKTDLFYPIAGVLIAIGIGAGIASSFTGTR